MRTSLDRELLLCVIHGLLTRYHMRGEFWCPGFKFEYKIQISLHWNHTLKNAAKILMKVDEAVCWRLTLCSVDSTNQIPIFARQNKTSNLFGFIIIFILRKLHC